MIRAQQRWIPPVLAARQSALGFWAGALLVTGAAAAISFPTMKALDPVLPAFAAYAEAHWSIAAGHIVRRIFFLSDIVQLSAGAIVILSLLAERWLNGRRRPAISWRVRGSMMIAAAALAGWQAFVMNPSMNANLDAYWDAARNGETSAAAALKAEFDGMHVTASRLMTTTFALVCASCIASVLAGADPSARSAEEAE